eukprot:6189453-Pleurochrysis_carterae.AAC.3
MSNDCQRVAYLIELNLANVSLLLVPATANCSLRLLPGLLWVARVDLAYRGDGISSYGYTDYCVGCSLLSRSKDDDVVIVIADWLHANEGSRLTVIRSDTSKVEYLGTLVYSYFGTNKAKEAISLNSRVILKPS